MKILIFSYRFHPDVGGIESISKMLADYFSKERHQVRLITKTKDIAASEFSFSVIRNPGLVRTIRELKWADIIFENNPCFSLSYPNFLIRKPSVIVLQTWLESLNGKYDLRQRTKHFLLNCASAVIACSEAIKTTFEEATVIPNPYNEKLFKTDFNIKRTKEFVFLGRLVSDKGADIAIKALQKIKINYPSASLTIIGDGEEMPVLKKTVQELQLHSNVCFKGILQNEELVSCLNEHEYIIVPSIWKEPFGIVALEGLACGCIPIVSNGGGLPEAAGSTGLVFERKNVDALAECMQQVLRVPSTYHLNASALEHLYAHRISVIGEKYLEVFKKALN